MFGFNRRKKEKNLQKEQAKGAPIVAFNNPKSIHAEQFRTIRTNLDFVNLDKPVRSIVITSSIPAEGKSTISANIAHIMGATEKKVLIVDADLRKPTVHRTFNLTNERGLSALFSQPDLKFNDVIQFNPELNLYLLPAGAIPPNPSELLASAKMTHIMEELKKYFDLVIYDTPPVSAITDAQIMASKVDGVVLVVREGYVTKEEVKNAKAALDNVNAKIFGYVINDKEATDSSGYYAYYGYSEE
ncbi:MULTISPECIES: CpsD/CapB family tyrosine-protein kinase [unclassified Facklamia]|uniref:CpsD/CapB family tyrosine-protein kinase n=1 Tax=Aerococcaceae TaxID=186827 RepID=UPI0013BBF099|nr:MULTISPECIES: CpsD/CapB family tyrosine-protein kinase [unclassified Facklamia]MBS4462479.1 CpsD/CapB family tyrosine-protein kinase [Aerococcaceae bacterium zg-B36]NEW65067.1 polysaccharide biosynthesis tyrosine autokinase [Facklamia sp. 252]NEW68724.1 polysaccharide biosynthesis tyrosine autokinase [Facklamia sp. 253]QQD65131.1 CpsD/CapB family tyrosine-protein kinase [Aerococcaceae bacterium zg-252]